MTYFIGAFGPVELGTIAFIIFMLLRANKSTNLGSTLGKSIRNFCSRVSGEDDEVAPGANGEPIPGSPVEIENSGWIISEK